LKGKLEREVRCGYEVKETVGVKCHCTRREQVVVVMRKNLAIAPGLLADWIQTGVRGIHHRPSYEPC